MKEEDKIEKEEPKKLGFFARLKAGLAKTQETFTKKIDKLVSKKGKIEPALYDELEEILYTSDLGPKTASQILKLLQERVEKEGVEETNLIKNILKEEMLKLFQPEELPLNTLKYRPFVIMVVGVNGTGKTTTIGKLGAQFTARGERVLFAAADTFRAAAIEQLEIWAKRVGCDIIKQASGADPSAVAFDAIQASLARDIDILLIDTAGRLHTKYNLMEELKKMRRVIGKERPGAPHEVLLVLDATTGQNAFQQVKIFKDEIDISGLILTKLDGTAKGGCVIGIYHEFGIPIRYIGVGESLEDLQLFNPKTFVDALFE